MAAVVVRPLRSAAITPDDAAAAAAAALGSLPRETKLVQIHDDMSRSSYPDPPPGIEGGRSSSGNG